MDDGSPSIVYRLSSRWISGLLFLLFLALYVRTSAPSVLSGDSAEFQMAAPLLGVPHPTTYPLYMLLGKLATLVIPFGDLAWRVTLVSAICGALAVALFFPIARHWSGSTPAALVGALALGLAPGLWNAATMAEVYALMMALIMVLLYAITADGGRRTKDEGRRTEGEGRRTDERPKTTDDRRPTAEAPVPSPQSLVPSPQPSVPNSQSPTPYLAAFLGGLGFAHHGLFVIAALPILAAYLLWWLVRLFGEGRRTKDEKRFFRLSSFVLRLGLCFAAGLLPWLYPLAQYARYGPFNGMDYGLPQHYFWGAPESWGQALDLLTGGPMRRGIFRIPSLGSILAVLRLVGQRLLFEFGPIGVLLGVFGSIVALRRMRIAWLGAAWVFFATLAYLVLLGPAVQDAPVFTLPMLLPWALWIAAGAEYVLMFVRRGEGETRRGGDKQIELHAFWQSPGLLVSLSHRRSALVLALLLAATLAWGYTRLHVSSKRQLWLFRRFGEATLAQLPPGAAVITHWEQGMTLQYLIRVEGRRPDVWIDVVEPNDVGWRDRARRYADRPVFFVGSGADVANLPVALVREDDYADVFELRR